MFQKTSIILFSILLVSVNVLAQNATRWRGPDGNGVYPEKGLLKNWPDAGPEMLWSFDGIGEGHSSPAIANNTIYISGMLNNQGYIFAFTPEGKLKWKKSYGKEFDESYPGARSTPVIADNLLYIFSGYGVVTAMDATNGAIQWQKNVLDEYGGRNLRWGITESLVVDKDNIYVTPGGAKNNIIALNRINGELVWSTTAKGEMSAYCTPLLINLPARKLLVTHTAKHIVAVDAGTGKYLWSYPHENRYDVHANTPIYKNGELFCFSGYGAGGVMFELKEDGTLARVKWENKNLDNRIGGMVEYNGFLYGSGDSNREWRCVNWKTGLEKYASKDFTKGAIIAADGNLYCYNEKGELALVKATPDGFQVVDKIKVVLGTAQHWAHPVINQNRLYLRHGNTLMAWKI